MIALLALAAAITFGTGDFVAGMAQRRSVSGVVVWAAQLSGAAVLALATFVLFRIAGPTVTTTDLVAGGLAGLALAAGFSALYAALARGPMGIAAPVAGVLGAFVPAVAGIVQGYLLSHFEAIGVALALASIWIATRSPSNGRAPDKLTIGLAATGGVGIGVALVLLSIEPIGAIAVRLVASRVVAALLLTPRAIRQITRGPVKGFRLALLAGAFDATGWFLYVLAISSGGVLSIVAILASLYPIPTVILANLIGGETLRRHQAIGLVTAVVAIALFHLP